MKERKQDQRAQGRVLSASPPERDQAGIPPKARVNTTDISFERDRFEKDPVKQTQQIVGEA